jgi:hypothetical protein|tara:strand:+ start:4554 stop:5339 length:786 start_codon:yes stop_codon:yes gene_type:complete
MSTTEQQEVNVPIEQPAANSAFEEDIISQQAGPEAAAVDQEPTQEQSTSVDYEAESKKFQSMYDRAQAENAKLQQGAQILQLLEQRPDLVKVLEDGIAGNQQQKQAEPNVSKDDFNPWDAFTDENSESGRYVNTKIENLVQQRLNSALSQQQQQMQQQMQMQNTVNELRGTHKMSDNDINDFLQFTTQPKERVGLNNLVKLWQMQRGQSVANNDTMEAVNAAKQAPRTAGVLQGQPQGSVKSDANKMFDSIMNTSGAGRLP